MKVMIVPVTPYAQNCSILVCEASGRAAVVDPGGDLDRIEKALAQIDTQVEKVLLTHGHIDHCAQAGEFAQHHGVPIEGPQRADAFLLAELPAQGRRLGLANLEAFEPDRWLEEGDTATFGEQTLEVLHCPGHTPGHVVFFNRQARLAIVGDVLFQGSIGRTDFPRGDHAALIHSIRTKLWPLGDDVAFLPGHGPMSTFGQERAYNPFVGDDAMS